MNLDWNLLRQQKLLLLELCNKPATTPADRDLLDGIIHLIDGIQDYAVDQGNATEAEVFGPEINPTGE